MEIYILDGYTQAVILDSGNDSGTSVDRLFLKNIRFNYNNLVGWSGAINNEMHLFGLDRGGKNEGPYNINFLIIYYFTD